MTSSNWSRSKRNSGQKVIDVFTLDREVYGPFKYRPHVHTLKNRQNTSVTLSKRRKPGLPKLTFMR